MPISEVPLFVLAGGRATRLKHLSENLPKYLMPVDGGQVFADLHLKWAYEQGFRKVILSVGYLADQIVQYCGNGSKWGVSIEYVFDGPTLVGTGGATKKSLQFSFDYLAVTYGDTLLRLDCQDCLNKLLESNLMGCMTIYKNNVGGHVCNAELQGSIALYDKKNPHPSWKYIDYGFSIFKESSLSVFLRKCLLIWQSRCQSWQLKRDC